MKFDVQVTLKPDPNNFEKSTNRDSLTSEFRTGFIPKVTWYRWLVFGLYVLNLLILSGESLSFSPISRQLARAYDKPLLVINMASIVFTITQIPMSFVAIALFNRFDNAWVLRFGAFILLVGNWVRYFTVSTGQWYPVLIG